MIGSPHTVRLLAVATLFIAAVGFAVPVCAMPGCEAPSLSVCSSLTPGCGDCDAETPIMKHVPDEATLAQPMIQVTDAAAVAPTVGSVLALVAYTVPEPDATGAPPPLGPLGVRLII